MIAAGDEARLLAGRRWDVSCGGKRVESWTRDPTATYTAYTALKILGSLSDISVL
jgi:hypothetical protein